MKLFVNRFVDTCDSCQRVKTQPGKPFGSLQPLPIPAGPWTDLSYDLITGLPLSEGMDSILVIVDRLTKMGHFVACNSTMDSAMLADLMIDRVWKLHGTPKSIVSDRGNIFISRLTTELNERFGIKTSTSTSYHPESDGQTEIVNKALEIYLHHFVNYKQSDWVRFLSVAEFSYNNSPHSSTGTSPFFANYGYNPTISNVTNPGQCIPEVRQRLSQLSEVQNELKESIKRAQEKMKEYYDSKRQEGLTWSVGDWVWLSSKNLSTTRPSAKLDHRWLGPYKIVERIGHLEYKLELPSAMNIHPVFHISLLKPYVANTIEGRVEEKPEPIELEGETEWEVDDILERRKRRGKIEYLVSWKGYGKEHDSWESEINVQNCKELVDEFNEKYPSAEDHYKVRRRKK